MSATLFRFTNTAILALVLLLTATGLISFLWLDIGWLVHIHRIGSWALLALVPWKTFIIWRSLRRGLDKRPTRNIMILVSLLLACMVIMSIILGLLWNWQIGQQTWLRRYLLWWHWILALVLLLPFFIHVWQRWPRPKRADFTSRRAALRMIGLGTIGIVGWRVAERIANARNPIETPRLITGSRLVGAYSGNRGFPITGESASPIDVTNWKLNIVGAVQTPYSLTLSELTALPQEEREDPLDCTNGWWTVQYWQGIPLSLLLEEAGLQEDAIAVRISSVTGYGQVFSFKEAEQMLICTHIGGEALTHWHGAPARATAPTRRGSFWVKWVTEIEVLNSVSQIIRHPISIR